VDVAIGEKFHVLDADHDGRLSEGELTEVLQTMFRTKVTEEEAKNKVGERVELMC
jgi:Ca2+-binding EF-hand superfamily protein